MVLERADGVRAAWGRGEAEAMLSDPSVKPTPNVDANARRATNFISNLFMNDSLAECEDQK
jgi:hypothetical protein